MKAINRSPKTIISLITFLLIISLLISAAPVFADDWPSFRNDASNSGASSEVIALPLVERWHSSAPSVEENGAVVSNGVVYMSSNVGLLYAFDVATGDEITGFPVTTSPNYGTPAVDAVNEIVYVLAGSQLFGFNLDGTPAWTPKVVGTTGSNYNQGPIVDEGYVFFKAGDFLQKFDASGTLQWTSTAGGSSTQPAIMGDYVYLNSDTGLIRKYLKSTGEEILNGFPISVTSQGASLAAADGKLFYKADQLYAYDASNGSTLWAAPAGGNSSWNDSPSVADGVVYVYGADSIVYAFDTATGIPMAGFPSVSLGSSNRNYSSPAVAGDYVFIGAGITQKLMVIGAANTANAGVVLEEHLTFSADTQGFDLCSPIISDGVVFAMLDGGGLYAFYSSDTPWTGGAITINDGAECTADPAVILAIDRGSNEEANEMMISEDPFFGGASWEPYATTKPWTLSDGFGTKTVYVQFRAGTVLSNVFNDSIEYSETCGTDNITAVWTIEKTAAINELTLSPGEQYQVDYEVSLNATAVGEPTIDTTVDVSDSEVGALGTYAFNEVPITINYSVMIGPFDVGDYTVTNTASFVTNDTATAGEDTWSIDVSVVDNSPPDAEDDAATTADHFPVNIPVLDNDSDPDGDPLVVSDVAIPSNGIAIDNGDGTITYTSNPGFSGEDIFEYTIEDGRGGSDTANVTVTVLPYDLSVDPAVAVNPVDTSHTIYASVGVPIAGIQVTIEPAPGSLMFGYTDENGDIEVGYGTGTARTDDIDIWIDYNENGVLDTGEPHIQQIKHWITLESIEPTGVYNLVGTEHLVTVRVYPHVADATVNFEVSGANEVSGSSVTDENGYAVFCYTGTNDGEDTITAFLDQNPDGVWGEYDPLGHDSSPKQEIALQASKYWIKNYFTGGGNIKSSEGKGNKARYSFSGTVGVVQGVGIFGQFGIVVHDAKKTEAWKARTGDFQYLEFTGEPTKSPPSSHDTATFVATFTSNRGHEVTLRITIQDLGEPGKNTDSIMVEVVDGDVWFEGLIDGGNWQMHDQE